jgi:D-alanyl-D-alanine carboxypeptidase
MDILFVNKNHPLPDDYKAENLTPLKDVADGYFELSDENLLFNKTATDSLCRLLDAAAAAGHKGFRINSAYRTRKYQEYIFKNRKTGFIQLPGCSEHETGLAIDIVEYGTSNGQLLWITENSADYGFILRYPENKEHLTGIPYEPWHFRYVGVEIASYMKEHNICLEEYMHEKYNVPLDKFEVKRPVNPNEKIIWDFLYNKLKNPYAVAGIMGNLCAESSLIANVLEYKYQNKFEISSEEYTEGVDNGTYDNFANDAAGYGLAQWTYHKRKAKLLSYAKQTNRSISDLEMQLEFLWIELKTDYKDVYDSIIDSTSVKHASDIVLTDFENPDIIYQSEPSKIARANTGLVYYYKYINKKQLEDNLNQLELWREDVSYIMTDYETDEILYEKNIDKIRPIGSITKVMVIYTLADKIFTENRLKEIVTVDKEVAEMSRDRSYSGNERFIEGEQWPVETLLNMSLIASACASTVALARHFCKTDEACIKKMNEVAADLNMSAHFSDVVGSEPNSAASAKDLTILSKKIISEYPEVLSITSKKSYIFKHIEYTCTNPLIKEGLMHEVDGLKTGSTPQAGKNFVATATRGGKRVIAVILNSQETYNQNLEMHLLLEYGLAKIDESNKNKQK